MPKATQWNVRDAGFCRSAFPSWPASPKLSTSQGLVLPMKQPGRDSESQFFINEETEAGSEEAEDLGVERRLRTGGSG